MTVFKETSKTMRRLCSTMDSFQEGLFYLVQRIEEFDHPHHRLNQLSTSTQRITDKLDPVLGHSSVALQSFTDTSKAVRDLAQETRRVLAVLDPDSVNSLVRNVNSVVTELNEAVRLLLDLSKLILLCSLVIFFGYGLFRIL